MTKNAIIMLMVLITSNISAAQYVQQVTHRLEPYSITVDGRTVMVRPNVLGDAVFPKIEGYQPNLDLWNLDEITPLPGWPVQVSGYSFNGVTYCDMDADEDLEVLHTAGDSVYAWNVDGTSVPGWPQETSYWQSSAPAFGDIDGDGLPEIVVSTHGLTSGGMIHAFELDGSIVIGFPLYHGYAYEAPVLADLDNDHAFEIITNLKLYPNGEQCIYRGDGSEFPGWPQPLEGTPASSAAVGDITSDGLPEIVGESHNALYVWDIDGNLLPGFPYFVPYGALNSWSSPVLVDLDGDGYREIVFGSHTSPGGYLFILRNDGTDFPGWPKSTSQNISSAPAVGFVDGDDILDIVVGDESANWPPDCHIYAWNACGESLDGFPIGPLDGINCQILLGDIDGDGMLELITDDNAYWSGTHEGKYHAYNHDGTVVEDWPMSIQGCSFCNTPALIDINRDGILNMIGQGTDAAEYWTNTYIWTMQVAYIPENITLPVFQYNAQYTGVAADSFVIPCELDVTLTPENPPIIIQPEGGSFGYTVEIQNMGSSTAIFDAWIEAELPNGSLIGPILLREELNLEVGSNLIRDMIQVVPGNAPSGEYVYRLNIGYSSSIVFAKDGFSFTKSGSDVNITGAVWNLSSWDIKEVDGIENFSIPEYHLILCSYPNPFNSSTAIRYQLSALSHVNLSVYDIAGRKVAELVNSWRDAGEHEVMFDGSSLASGIYIYCLSAESGHCRISASGKMVLVK